MIFDGQVNSARCSRQNCDVIRAATSHGDWSYKLAGGAMRGCAISIFYLRSSTARSEFMLYIMHNLC